MSIELIFLIIYFVAMAGIGVATMRRGSGDAEDYLLGGRSLGPAVTALRLQSSSMSGYMFMGAGGLGYSQGYFGMWYALGDIGGGVLNLSILGRRMRKLSQILGSITSIEYLEHRYPSKWTRVIAGVIALACLFFYVMGQFIAGGSGLAMVTGLSYPVALALAIGVIVFYTFLGGYLAVAYTDFVQAIVMVIGMLWILIATLQAVGGFTAGNEAIGAERPDLLTMWGADLQYQGQWGIILGALLVFSIGYMGWPHVVVSHMATKRPSVARRAGVYATIFNLLFIPGAYLVGIMAIVLLPTLDNPEMAIFDTAAMVLPPVALGVVMAAIMAAIMSTADALLLQGGTVASYDIFARFFGKDMGERTLVWVSRITVMALALVGYLIAVNNPPTIATMIIFATSVLGAAFVPAYVCAVWWRKANTVGAIASMVTGTVVTVAWELAGLAGRTGIETVAAGIGASILAMVIGSLVSQSWCPVPERIQEAVEATADVGPIPARLLTGQNQNLAGQIPVER